MLSYLLAISGIDSVVVDNRSRAEIEQTVRAGILESGSARLLVDSGVSDRVLRDGDEHRGMNWPSEAGDIASTSRSWSALPCGCTPRPRSSSISRRHARR
jgi:2-polyprenyl-6-methoxyphenol hydroxylase-like FAD-dependent oxidoreductase